MTTDTETQSAYRTLVASLKLAVKGDAESIRAKRRLIRDAQAKHGSGAAATSQGELHVWRGNARANLLVYGFVRGRPWERTESTRGKQDIRIQLAVANVYRKFMFELAKTYVGPCPGFDLAQDFVGFALVKS